jgi:hypothetical protein
MLKIVLLLGSLLVTVGLLYTFGPYALLAYSAMALGTAVFSTGGPESCPLHDGHSGMGNTTFLAGL